MADAPIIVWFRQDLRLADNRALGAAAAAGRPVLPVHVLDDAAAAPWPMGGASRWWLDGSLGALDASLRELGSRLLLRRGPTVSVLMRLAAETGARAIHFTRAYEPGAARLEQELHAACRSEGIEARRFGGSLLAEPEVMRTRSGEPYRVFTPFWRALGDRPLSRVPLPAPGAWTSPSAWPMSDERESWRLRPTSPDWAGGLRATWRPGERGAEQRLAALIDGALRTYARDRDRPDMDATSMLSPHLHFGEVSPDQCWHAIDLARRRDPSLAAGAAAFLRELGWREFSYHLLHHWPSIAGQAFRPEYEAFPWEADHARAAASFEAWSRGRTGYPIVDAGMRQLWQTGWMHNRVRMIAASFLTKHLLVPWQQGARWFWDTLVDADLANNSASWQWVAGSGADAAPYFRVFNPVLQGRKFDPDGRYVRRYVPELDGLPADHIHAPWTAPPSVLAKAGVMLAATYPEPIVDHDVARRRALAAFASLKAAAPRQNAPDDAS